MAEARIEACLLDALPDGVLLADAAGLIVYTNAQLDALFGYARGALLGASVESLVPSAARAAHADCRASYLAVGEARPMGGPASPAFTGVRADGTSVEVHVSLVPVVRSDERCVAAIVRDAREAVAIGARLRAGEDASERADALEDVSDLARGVAHDMNNLLCIMAAVVGEADALAADDRLRAVLADIELAVDRATALNRTLLAASSAEDGRTDLAEVVRQVVALARRRLVGVEVVLELGRDVPPVAAARVALEQVVFNLVGNAGDAMPDGGTLRVEIASAANGVRLSITDTGTGIDPAVLPRIFERHFTTKRPGKGTGLGLATVWAIVRRLGGEIRVASTPGEGTRFEVDLPAAD